MPFPWLHPAIPPEVRGTFHDKALRSMREEVRQRAALLMHLGLGQAEAATRCRQNLLWDLDLHFKGRCAVLEEVDNLVREVYQRR